MSVPVGAFLHALGEWWVFKPNQKHGDLMHAWGAKLKPFLINLHSRIVLIYPKLSVPEFKVPDVEENSL